MVRDLILHAPSRPSSLHCPSVRSRMLVLLLYTAAHSPHICYLRAGVLGPETSQHEVFLSIGLPVVEAVMSGRRACLFAYGQTGSGKTFSMYGADGGKNPAKLDGAVPLICAELFRRKIELEKRRHNVRMAIYATLVEVRGKEIIDLIADPMNNGGEQPRVKLARSELEGARREVINSQSGLTALIERGAARCGGSILRPCLRL